MFLEDVKGTSDRIIARAKVVAAERAAEKEANPQGREQIQLVAADPATVITFEVPDGPPPEKLEITGEGSEELDPELVRQFLQRRWDIFESFSEKLRKALTEKSLDKVNKVLGKMEVPEAEEVVRLLQEGGILSVRVRRPAHFSAAPTHFAQLAVRDQRHHRPDAGREHPFAGRSRSSTGSRRISATSTGRRR